jgi:hypothetical protein
MLDARFQLQAAQVHLLRQTERLENWAQSVAHARPEVVSDENGNCESWQNAGGGEGYSGPACTGTLIAATHADNCQAAYSGGGVGYTGPVCTPPAGDQTTIGNTFVVACLTYSSAFSIVDCARYIRKIMLPR